MGESIIEVGRRARCNIDLLGSLRTNEVQRISRRYPVLGFFYLTDVSLDRDSGTFNSSNTELVEKVNSLVAASLHGALRWRKDPHRTEIALFNLFNPDFLRA